MNKVFEAIVDLFIIVVFIFTAIVTIVIQVNVKRNSPLYIDVEFVPYFKQFQKDANKYKKIPNFQNMTTTFIDDISGETLAYCLPKFNTIKVSRRKWNRLSTISKKLLLYHEWGHCALRREHVENTYDTIMSVCPDSIMYPYIEPIQKCYHLNTDWYDKELFTNFNNRELFP